MLQEIRSGRWQEAGSGLWRRWFQDDDFDLFVWEDGEGRVVTLQLAWNRQGAERLVLWERDRGCRGLGVVDQGERDPSRNHSPVLSEENLSGEKEEMLQGRVLGKLRSGCAGLPEGVRQAVGALLEAVNSNR
ncbi:MAG: hypothetical protein HQL63_03405 [Magnetococcales bacterium]|nr:hypothetical protein [Magnetococcales bacterium]MBF0322200.1 hypothetical protein [Magnetococcales bacterium]